MTIPTTPEDFRKIGLRFNSEDLVKETDRLLVLARADAAELATQEFGSSDVARLEGYRESLTHQTSERRASRGEKRGSRRAEVDHIVDGKRLLRVGMDVAWRQLGRLVPAEGAAGEEARKTIATIEEQLGGLAGPIGLGSVKLRTRLGTLLTILALPEMAPAEEFAETRAKLIADITEAAAALPSTAETKKALQAASVEDTAKLDELDGRTYTLLKSLCAAGRTYHIRAGNPKRTAEYTLTGLRSARRRVAETNGSEGSSTPKE